MRRYDHWEEGACEIFEAMADALIEIAVRNGPRRTPNHKYDWDPVAYAAEHAAEEYEGCIGGDCARDYVTAARALGIL